MTKTLDQCAECLKLTLKRHDHEDLSISFWFPANIYLFKVINKDTENKDIEEFRQSSKEVSKILFNSFMTEAIII